jgi:hypothetical protein
MAIIMTIFPPVAESAELVTLLLPFTSLVLIELPIIHVVPVLILFTLFSVTMFFGGFAEILTHRVLLDAIPNRNRNSIYSLQPTILLLLSIPQIVFFGWFIPNFGFPLTLTGCALVSLAGVLVIRYSLGLEIPRCDDVGDQQEKESTAAELVGGSFEEVDQVAYSPE